MPRRVARWLWFSSLAILTLALAVLAGADHAQPAPSAKVRVVDQTLRCSVSLRAGLRLVSVNGQSGVRDQAEPSKWFGVAEVSLSTQGSTMAGVQAGTPRMQAERRVPQPDQSFWLDTRVCKRVAARISFGPSGLGGGRLNQFVERYKCTTPTRILLRVRAEFRAPVALQTRDGWQSTEAPLAKGFLAIRSEKGKPLLYADVVETGRARLFFAGSCQRG